MKDISARELKGHNILAVERFEDSTRWMIEFVILSCCADLRRERRKQAGKGAGAWNQDSVAR